MFGALFKCAAFSKFLKRKCHEFRNFMAMIGRFNSRIFLKYFRRSYGDSPHCTSKQEKKKSERERTF